MGRLSRRAFLLTFTGSIVVVAAIRSHGGDPPAAKSDGTNLPQQSALRSVPRANHAVATAPSNAPSGEAHKEHAEKIQALAVSPNGKMIGSTSEQETKLWDVDSKTTRWKGEGFHDTYRGGRVPFVFSPDSRWIAFAPRDVDLDSEADIDAEHGTVEVRNTTTGQIALKFTLETRSFRASDVSIAFSPDSRFVAATGLHGEVWDIAARKLQTRFGEKPRLTYQLLFSPNGKFLIGTGADWKKGNLQGTGQFSGSVSTGDVYDAIWDAGTGKLLATIPYGRYDYNAALSLDGKLLAITDGWDRARIYEIPSGNLVRELRKVERDYLSFTPDGKELVTAVFGGSSHFVVRIADLHTGHVEETLSRTEYTEEAGVQYSSFRANAVMFSPTTSLAAILESNGDATVLETRTGRELALVRGGKNNLTSIAFFPDERRIAVGHENGSISIWDIERGESGKSAAPHSR